MYLCTRTRQYKYPHTYLFPCIHEYTHVEHVYTVHVQNEALKMAAFCCVRPRHAKVRGQQQCPGTLSDFDVGGGVAVSAAVPHPSEPL